MNDIQTEVNFFEWFDKYYKPKILTNRTTNFLLQKEATDRTIITKARPLTKNTRHIIPNTRPLTTNHAIADNIDLAKKQMQTINRTTKNWLKVESKEIVHEELPPYESIIINHRNQQLLASPMKNVSLSDETKNF